MLLLLNKLLLLVCVSDANQEGESIAKAAMLTLVDVVRSVYHVTSPLNVHYLESYITYLLEYHYRKNYSDAQ
jgi:hypothetical protein